MAEQGFTVFETAIGFCGIVWSDRGIAGVQLPESTASATRARMLLRFAGAADTTPPPGVTQAIDAIRSLLLGEATDLSAIELDMDRIPAFERSVYDVARTIAPGRTLTYGDVAARVGTPKDARAVGQALGRNPFPIVVPCHRVVASDGRMHGFSGTGGVKTKLRLLQIEGWRATEPTLFEA